MMNPSAVPVLLCVDDDLCVLSALRRLFRSEPVRVVTAANAAQALASLRHDPVEVVITDERMPDTSGSEFLAEVRQRWPWIGRVILTSYPENVAAMQGLDAGVDVLAHKPWSDDGLKRMVRQLLGVVQRKRMDSAGDRLAATLDGEGTLMTRILQRHVVVLVDDEPEVLSALRRSLRQEPYVLLTTPRPEEALDWVRSRDVSAVVADQRMPGMTGIELAERIYAHSPATARIILTGHAGAIAKEAPLRRRIECLIAKPWDDTMLRRTLRSFMSDGAVDESTREAR